MLRAEVPLTDFWLWQFNWGHLDASYYTRPLGEDVGGLGTSGHLRAEFST